MGFIGNKPSAVPLTSSDLADNIITSAKIVDGTIASADLAAGVGITKSASDPTGSTNPAGGVGTVFLNTTSGEMFSLTDATTNANVWTNIGDGTGALPVNYMSGTGGTITTDGNFKVHTFNSSGTFTPTIGDAGDGDFVEYLVVAGGGGGAGGSTGGGGGGAGGYRTSSSFTVSNIGLTVTVGAGGIGNITPDLSNGTNGNDSVFSSITSAGGGFGSSATVGGIYIGGSGGSGGGGTWTTGGVDGVGGAGNTPSTTPSQGNTGGDALSSPVRTGGGGGGASAVGVNGGTVTSTGGNGGAGTASSISGAAVTYAGGGAGGGWNSGYGGTGGAGGGGNGSGVSGGTQTAGTTNTGGGGGSNGNSVSGANGGSGVVIIRYQFQAA